MLNTIGAYTWVGSNGENDSRVVLEQLSGHASRASISAACDIIGAVLYVPALLALVHLLRPRAPRLSLVAGMLSIGGMMGFMGINTMSVVQIEMTRGDADREQMIALLDRIQEAPAAIPILVLFLIGALTGLSTTAVALWLTRVVPRWLPPLIIGFLVWDILIGGIARIGPRIAGVIDPHLLALAGLAPIGVLLMLQSDEAWARHEPVDFTAKAWNDLVAEAV